MVAPHVARGAARAGHGADEPERLAVRVRDGPGALEPLGDGGGLEEQVERALEVAQRGIQPAAQLLGHACVHVVRDAAGTDEPAAEAVAAKERGHVEELAAQPAAVRGGRHERHVAGERAEVAGVRGQPLELERERAQCVRARRDFTAAERLERLRVRESVADGRVARQLLDLVHRARVRPPDQRALEAAVLVAEHDLEVQHLLAVALEAEVAGLDDAGVHGPDGDLVHLIAFHAEERVVRADAERRVVQPVRARAVRRVAAQRLEPRVAGGQDAELLHDLALEARGGDDVRGERRVLGADRRRHQLEAGLAVARGDQQQLRGGRLRRRAGSGPSEEGDDARLTRHAGAGVLRERVRRQARDRVAVDALRVARPCGRDDAHGAPPSRAAAFSSSRPRPGGT